jgi:hypothetical protein
MDYVTVNGVTLRTGYIDINDWYLLCMRELLDNAIDFLWKYCKGADDAIINVEIIKNDSLFHIKIQNTNSKNIPVFQNIKAIFDYDMRYGSKQNQHIISRGILGDAMKQILAWPYVLLHTKDNGSAFTDKQWDRPLIIRCNGIERQIYLHVDKGNQVIQAKIEQSLSKLANTDTEIEITWPIIDDVNLDIHRIEEFCRKSIVFTTDISFQFRLTDNSYERENNDNDVNNYQENRSIIPKKKSDDLSQFTDALTSPARKATIKIDAPRLHPINTEWNNISSIHSFKPEEFVAAFTSVQDKKGTTIYDVLRTFREGNSIKKDSSNQMPVIQLISDSKMDKKIESLYHKLKKNLDPPKRLSLPYSNIKPDERKRILVDRIAQIYGSNNLDVEKAVYKIVHDQVNGGNRLLCYPFAIEIIAIPFDREIILKNEDHGSRFIGAVNYSIPPRSNKFDGDYNWDDKNFFGKKAGSMVEILERYNFEFWGYAEPKTKLPCIIAANLISPRIDYHGHDKSRIDTKPFAKAIIEAARRIADEIPSFRADGYIFSKKQKRTFDPHYGHSTAKESLKKFLEDRRKKVLGY